MDTSSFVVNPIGFLRSKKKYKSEAPRQAQRKATKPPASFDLIELQAGSNFEQALEDLEGFSHIWVIFQFHQSPHWKPKIQPPRGVDRKVGVFASRSPYRPNALGLSLVRLREVRGRRVWIDPSDLLDGTPILDLKPYVPSSDQARRPRSGWMTFLQQPPLKIRFSRAAEKQLEWIDQASPLFSLREKIIQQLEYSPFQRSSKRVTSLPRDGGLFAHRYWRILFHVRGQTLRIVTIHHELKRAQVTAPSLPQEELAQYQAFSSEFPRDDFEKLLKKMKSK